ncbi:MAG: nonribosomal peptide synthetase DhbF [Crocinitomicaceae bacterium]|jgi:nonribosomal peptide synthetase DhbF
MKMTQLRDGTKVFCLRSPEAKMLDHHVDGYLKNGIEIKAGDVIFDVGANIGIFGIRAVQSFPDTTIYCFEPIPEINEVLQGNADLFDSKRLKVLPYGISDVETTATFSYYPNTPALSTLHPEDWDNDPGAFAKAVKGTMRNPPPGMKWMRAIPTAFSGLIAKNLVKGKKDVKCELKRLSSIIKEYNIEQIDLLKVDCEGAELGVIKSIEEQDWPKVKSLVVEVNDQNGRLDQIKSILVKQGFTSIQVEREEGLEETLLFNLFATRK